MNRRDIIKTVGLAAAGTALLPLDSLAKASSLNFTSNDNLKDTSQIAESSASHWKFLPSV